MKRLLDILEKTGPELIYNHYMIDIEVTREEFFLTIHKWSDLQLRYDQIENN